MEAAHAAHLAAKAERVAEKRRLWEAQQLVARKLQALDTGGRFLAGLHDTVWTQLERKGFWNDAAAQQAEAFLPLLFQQVEKRLADRQEAQARVDASILAVSDQFNTRRVTACLALPMPTADSKAPFIAQFYRPTRTHTHTLSISFCRHFLFPLSPCTQANQSLRKYHADTREAREAAEAEAASALPHEGGEGDGDGEGEAGEDTGGREGDDEEGGAAAEGAGNAVDAKYAEGADDDNREETV